MVDAPSFPTKEQNERGEGEQQQQQQAPDDEPEEVTLASIAEDLLLHDISTREASALNSTAASSPINVKQLSTLCSDIIGSSATFSSPYSPTTPLVYADYTASSRALASIEAFIKASVLPLYGNTHTTTSITGKHLSLERAIERATFYSLSISLLLLNKALKRPPSEAKRDVSSPKASQAAQLKGRQASM
jgi:hypothetical protein